MLHGTPADRSGPVTSREPVGDDVAQVSWILHGALTLFNAVQC